MLADRFGQTLPPTHKLIIETPIQRCLILAKPSWTKDFAHILTTGLVGCNTPDQITCFRSDATMKIRGKFSVSRQSSHVIVPKEGAGPQKPVRPRDPVASGERDAAQNRVASHNYFLLEKYEAGVALRGTEVKSIREGKANLKDSYGLVKDGEAFLLNLHIGPYSHGNIANHDETRTRKLLMHREEVRKLQSKTQIKGHTLIPTRLYFRNGRVKCELALAKGKQDWDKRETERSREADREARAAINANKHRRGN